MCTNRAIGLRLALSVFFLASGLASVAQAVDGTFLISQNLVNASGGFPYTITQPGSYRLTSNLSLPDENTVAIRIGADNVTLDFNGFSIIGPVSCAGTPPICSPANGRGAGVDPGAKRNITVMNGTIRGTSFGVGVIDSNELVRGMGDNGTVRGMKILSVGGHPFSSAISFGNSSLVAENILKDISGEGIFGTSGNTITNNVVTNVGQFGACINTGGSGGHGGTISNNTCRDASAGIVSGGGYLYSLGA